MNYKKLRNAVIAAGVVALISACGAGGDTATSDGSGSTGSTGGGSSGGGGNNTNALQYTDMPASKADAARFLNQATFGATDADVDHVMALGYAAWVDEQLAKPVADGSHTAYMDTVLASLAAGSQNYDQQFFFQSWWKQALTSDDQLRQRVAFALSQITVISYQNDTLGGQSMNVRGVASYYDMLERDAFANYRTTIDDVTYHPMMGIFLTSRGNVKETVQNGVITRTPDENYAREVMQLFTIGLEQLNPDGTQIKSADGTTVLETYTKDDIAGLAKVFTGLSWAAPAGASDATSNSRFNGGGTPANLDKEIQPMGCYPQYHSVSAKAFLGSSIGQQTTASADSCKADIKFALDKLFNHQNIGPFIATRLIKQLTTSNPSPAYVKAVAAKFADNGAGVRGDMKAVVREILLNNEARITRSNTTDTGFGKLREPVVRVAQWLRATETASAAASVNQVQRFTVGYTDNQLQQTAMRASGVFNFWRPGYVPPNSALGTASLTSPEMQAVQELSVTSYINQMKTWVQNGIGSGVTVNGTNVADLKPTYAKELALATDVNGLTDRLNTLYMGGFMTTAMHDQVTTAIASISVPALTATNQTTVDNAKLNRVRLAEFLVLSSPEYLSQK